MADERESAAAPLLPDDTTELIERAEALTADITPVEHWTVETEWCDCGDGFGCSHGEYVVALNIRHNQFATKKPDALWPNEFGVNEVMEMTDADIAFIAAAPALVRDLIVALAGSASPSRDEGHRQEDERPIAVEDEDALWLVQLANGMDRTPVRTAANLQRFTNVDRLRRIAGRLTAIPRNQHDGRPASWTDQDLSRWVEGHRDTQPEGDDATWLREMADALDGRHLVRTALRYQRFDNVARLRRIADHFAGAEGTATEGETP